MIGEIEDEYCETCKVETEGSPTYLRTKCFWCERLKKAKEKQIQKQTEKDRELE